MGVSGCDQVNPVCPLASFVPSVLSVSQYVGEEGISCSLLILQVCRFVEDQTPVFIVVFLPLIEAVSTKNDIKVGCVSVYTVLCITEYTRFKKYEFNQ